MNRTDLVHIWAERNNKAAVFRCQGRHDTLAGLKADPRNAGIPAGDWPTDAELDALLPTLEKEALCPAVNTERERRIALPKRVDVTGVGPINVQADPQSLFNVTVLCARARENILAGDMARTITFRDADNTNRTLTNDQMIELAWKVDLQVDAIWKASWVLKDTNPIPADFKNDKHWP